MNRRVVRYPRRFVGAFSIGPVLSACCVSLALVNESFAQVAVDSSDEEILSALAPELSEARLLTMSELSAEQVGELRGIVGVGRRFVGDFDSDGQTDLALFGEHPSGNESGTFVLLASMHEATWHRADLLQFTEPFIVGRLYDNVLMVFFCVGCDYGGRISRRDGEYVFVSFASAGE